MFNPHDNVRTLREQRDTMISSHASHRVPYVCVQVLALSYIAASK